MKYSTRLARRSILARDVLDLTFSSVDDGTMEFIRLPNGRRTDLGASGALRETLLP
jgi:hypothetical protein